MGIRKDMMSDSPLRHNQTLVQHVLRRYGFKLDVFTQEEQDRIEMGDIDRAAGDVICEHCGNMYKYHPGIDGIIANVVVTCDWKVYKL